MKNRNRIIAVLMTALCLMGTMPLSTSANKTLFVLGDIYQYNDVKCIESAYIEPDDGILPIQVEGVLEPIDLTISDSEGSTIGSIDIISANIEYIIGGRYQQTNTEDGVNVIQEVELLEIYFSGDILIYAPYLGYNIPKYFTDTTFRIGFIHQELSIEMNDDTNVQINDAYPFVFYDGTFEQETVISKPNIRISIDNIIDDTLENEAAIIDIMAAFIPANPLQTQLNYTFEGYSSMATNAFDFIQNYVVINNPILLIALCIMAFALCLIILKFIFQRR